MKIKTKELKIEKEFTFLPQMKIVLGCSGGADSMALFDMLLKLREKYDLFLVVAHVNHNIRKESKMEEEYLKNFCQEKNIVFESMLIEKYGDDNFHNEARNIRYQFFEEVIAKYQAQVLMTAHHADDLMETILMRIARGSHLKGYSGFQKIVDKETYKIVRPLISFTKEELLDYDNKNHVTYYEDSSNKLEKYTRNRYRKKILPFLKEEDRNIHQKYQKFSQCLYEANCYIEKETQKAKKRVLKENRLQIAKWKEEEDYIKKEILYELLEEFYQDDLILVNDKHIQLLERLLMSKRANLVYNLPNEVLAVKNYDECYLERKPDFIGSYEIEFFDFATLPNGHIIERVDEVVENGNDVCRLNSSEITFPLRIRTRKLGDKISCLGMKGEKKLKNIFIDAKIEPKKRELWPVVVDASGKVLWVPGLKKSKFNKTKTEKYDIIMKYR